MSSIDLFGDFCLTCDRQTNGTTFCSQSCRLAELDRYTNSEPSSPSYYPGSSSSSTQRSSTSRFSLPPAYDFSIHRSSSSSSLCNSTLSSKSSSTTTSKLTEQARSNLRDYVGSFDQTRTLKRRVSMQSS